MHKFYWNNTQRSRSGAQPTASTSNHAVPTNSLYSTCCDQVSSSEQNCGEISAKSGQRLRSKSTLDFSKYASADPMAQRGHHAGQQPEVPLRQSAASTTIRVVENENVNKRDQRATTPSGSHRLVPYGVLFTFYSL